MDNSSSESSNGRSPVAIRLRPLAEADLEPIRGLLARTGAFDDKEIAVALELAEEALRSADDYLFVVAETAGALAGYACYGKTPLCEGVYDLYWIAVDPSRQRLGVGRALLSAVEEAVRGAGGRMVLVETASKASYASTRAFYERTGYREIARVPDFYRVGDDKLIYSKRFPLIGVARAEAQQPAAVAAPAVAGRLPVEDRRESVLRLVRDADALER